MSRYRIPEKQQKAIEFLFELKDSVRRAFFHELSHLNINMSLSAMQEHMEQKFQLGTEKTVSIIGTLLTLSMLKDSSNIDIDSFVSEIHVALEKLDNKKLKPPKDFDNQLKRLLNLDESSFILTSKAHTLISDKDKILENSRIITDIRPIFTDDDDCVIKANAIIHNLKLEYQEDGDNKSIYFAASNKVLENLKVNIGRAKKKEEVLREKLIKSDSEIFDYQEQ